MNRFVDCDGTPVVVGDWVETPPNASDPIFSRITAMWGDWSTAILGKWDGEQIVGPPTVTMKALLQGAWDEKFQCCLGVVTELNNCKRCVNQL